MTNDNIDTMTGDLLNKRPDGTPVYGVECPECGEMVMDSPAGWSNHEH